MSRNGNSISLDAQNKCLEGADEVMDNWKSYKKGEIDECQSLVHVENAKEHSKSLHNLVRIRHDDRMLKTHKALSCRLVRKLKSA